jgi:hypothetical protein
MSQNNPSDKILSMSAISALWRADMDMKYGSREEDQDNWIPLSAWRTENGYTEVSGQGYILQDSGVVVPMRDKKMKT